MSPRERAVLMAIAKALRGNPDDMDALAASYPVPPGYGPRKMPIRERAAILLKILADH
jgi:hypothetical protein